MIYMPAPRVARRSALTLLEMVVSLAIISIVLVSLGSVTILASRAMPDRNDPAMLRVEASEVLEQIVSEIQVAKTLVTATDTQVVFTIPDRDDDGADETVVYQWSGVADDPLLRKYNAGPLTPVMNHISGFDLDYNTVVTTQTPVPVTSAEVLLASHDPATNSRNYLVDDHRWIGQRIVPQDLPTDALGWSVTRVRLQARYTMATSLDLMQVQIRTAKADHTPTSSVLEQITLDEADLSSSYTWRDFSFSQVNDIDPGDRLCLVVKSDDELACYIRYDNQSGSGLLTSSDTGSDWGLIVSGKSMVYYIYGTYTTPATEVRSVSLTLSPSDDLTAQARASIVALPRPVMP